MHRESDRLAKNEALFRDVNERVKSFDVAQGASGDKEWEFLCECADPDCTERISMSLREYEAVRSSPITFAVVPGHEIADVEKVVQRKDRFLVVEKQAGGRGIARTTDRRSRNGRGATGRT